MRTGAQVESTTVEGKGWVGLPSHSNHEVLDTGLIRRHAGEVSHTAGALEGVIVPPNGHVNLVPRKRSVRGVRVCVCVRACDKQSYSLQQQLWRQTLVVLALSTGRTRRK